jgi:hypothetical protein
MSRRWTAPLLAVVVLAGGACGATINPATIEDAQTAARVKSALVNDPGIGVYAIEVRVTHGVARLSGRVPTAEDAARAVSLARGVPGVRSVQSDLTIGGAPATGTADSDPPGQMTAVPAIPGDLGGPADRRLFAVGGSFGWNSPRAGSLDNDASLGPLMRLGSGRGLGLSIGFGWYGTDLRATGVPDTDVVGRIRIKPVMAGVGYTVGNARVSMALSTVAGIAFNRVSPLEELTSQVPLQVRDSLAWRPGVSFWFDTSSRVAVNVSAGYVMTRPEITLLDDGEIVRRRLTADAFLLRVGMAYKVF